ncbi:hypothetical protein JCGZ_19812 [Jatropha curcas]|uniref:DUF4228 domain-containing protein n=1 Tax=Jatropha curcas TaxID=180498 RepID=A0A067JU01_JATCU|nr:uncharacterized protein LOC105643920 [Jatropha curcas]KDP27451.1 hypothetical protein JCGZ_19812 [Jatropha curcas]
MGCCFSTKSSSKPNNNRIRVVHLNGYVEDFEYPISASEVTGKASKQFLCTPTQLLSTGSNPLNPNTQLHPGQIYFLLPYSTLKSDCSPMDFAALVKKLSSIAKASHSNKCSTSRSILNCHATCSNRFEEAKRTANKPWKPILDTIREKSFNQKSESEVLKEIYMEMESETE